MITFAGHKPQPDFDKGYYDNFTQIPVRDVRDIELQPVHFTRRGKVAIGVGVILIGVLAARAGGDYLLSQHAADARSNELHKPWLLPADQVDRITVTNEPDGSTVASEFTRGADKILELGQIIGSEGIGPDHALMPGQEVLVPKALETKHPVISGPADTSIFHVPSSTFLE